MKIISLFAIAPLAVVLTACGPQEPMETEPINDAAIDNATNRLQQPATNNTPPASPEIPNPANPTPATPPPATP
jgi:hypothetical protein